MAYELVKKIIQRIIEALPTGDNVIGRVKVTDGTLVATVRDTGTTDSLNVSVVDGAGNQITSFGGSSTQYAEGDTDATITGTAMLWEDAADTLRAVSAAKPLPVGDGGGSLTVDGPLTDTQLRATPVPVSGTVTASGPLTDSQLRATPVPVSGTVTANAGTGPFPVSDNAGSLTIDAPVGTPVAARLSDGTVFLTTTGGRLSVDASGVAVPVTDNGGSLTVDGTVTANAGTGTFSVSGTLNVVGNISHDSIDTGQPVKIGGKAASSTPAAVQNNDRVDAYFDLNGRLAIFSESLIPGTGATNLGKAEDAIHSSSDVGVMALAVANEANTVRAADGDYIAIAADTEGNVRIVGNRDHGDVDTGEVVAVGGMAVSGSASPTPVAAGDRTRSIFNQHGIPYVLGGHPNLITREYDFGTSAQTDINLAAAAVAADERVYVTRLEITCDKTNTVNVSARAGFGATAVPTASASGVSGMIASHPGLAPGGGIISGTGGGIIAVGGAGEEPRFTSSAATTGNTHVLISYFLIDETP